MNTFTDNESRAKRRVEERTITGAEDEAVTSKLRKDFNDLTIKWIEKGREILKEIPQHGENALIHLEVSLKENKRKCKFWQTPLYKEKGYKSIEECMEYHRHSFERDVNLFNQEQKRIEEMSTRILGLIDSIENDNVSAVIEKKKKECERVLKEYEDSINSIVDGLFGISVFLERISSWEIGMPILSQRKFYQTLDKRIEEKASWGQLV